MKRVGTVLLKELCAHIDVGNALFVPLYRVGDRPVHAAGRGDVFKRLVNYAEYIVGNESHTFGNGIEYLAVNPLSAGMIDNSVLPCEKCRQLRTSCTDRRPYL